MNSYDLSRAWFDFCFANPEKVNPNHSAIFFFAIEHCNRLGWKEKFGFPTQMTMDAIGIKKHQTYIKYFNELCEWGFFVMVQKSVNQYSANIIKLSNGYTKNGKALDKAFITHRAKQTEKQSSSIGQSTGQSNSSIDKQYNKEQINNTVDDVYTPPPPFFTIHQAEKALEFTDAFALHATRQTNKDLKALEHLKVKFIEEQKALSKMTWPNENDLKKHFVNWCKKQTTPTGVYETTRRTVIDHRNLPTNANR